MGCGERFPPCVKTKAKRNIILVVLSVIVVLLSRQCLVFSLYIYSGVVF